MVLHVQSWFKINLDEEMARGTIVDSTAQGKSPKEPVMLGAGEILVGVEREGPNSNPQRLGWIQLKTDDALKEKIREWIAHCNAFRSSEVELGEGELLVSVRDEACSHTSHGMHCDCH